MVQRTKSTRLMINGISALMKQITIIICGLILPGIMIRAYGSSVNGAVSSVTQFIGLGALLQGGLSAAARVSFYKPLSETNKEELRAVYFAVKRDFIKFAALYVLYICILSAILPFIMDSSLDFTEIASLTLILGISTVAEYLFGISNELILFADQYDFLNNIVYSACLFTGTLISIVLIKQGYSIICVKFIYALLLCIRPFVLCWFVKKIYGFSKKGQINNYYIKQKGAALARSIAFYVHTNTDVILISLFLNTAWASVYAVHRYVAMSVSNIVSSVLGNIEAVFGKNSSNPDKKYLTENVLFFDWFSKLLSSVLFGTCLVLINHFVELYTAGVTDIEYSQPLFAYMLCVSEMIFCYGIIYSNIIMAFGHIKQTRWISVGEACINICLSIILLSKIGIIGIVTGTVIAMIFQTIMNMLYVRKYICFIPASYIAKLYIIHILGIILTSYFGQMILSKVDDFFLFILYGILVLAFTLIFFMLINMIFFRRYIEVILSYFCPAYFGAKDR